MCSMLLQFVFEYSRHATQLVHLKRPPYSYAIFLNVKFISACPVSVYKESWLVVFIAKLYSVN